VRIRLLKNPRAGQILDQLQWFQERRLQIHAQVVVCPGINDGPHLERTLLDLAKFGGGEVPGVISVAVVPVGLTKFRPQEDELVPVTREKAREVISQVQQLQPKFRRELGSTFVWLADEWFLMAGEDLPEASEYEDYPQLGNGVGSIRQFLEEFEATAMNLPSAVSPPRRLTWVVGNAVENAFQPILDRLNAVEGLTVEMIPLYSEFWGQTMSVTGVLTGEDVRAGLRDRDLGDGVLLPDVMLKYGETRFLDDVTVDDLVSEFKTPVLSVCGIDGLLEGCIAPLPQLEVQNLSEIPVL
jgi:putative radical SAM enzyme (TIGR03279 family)